MLTSYFEEGMSGSITLESLAGGNASASPVRREFQPRFGSLKHFVLCWRTRGKNEALRDGDRNEPLKSRWTVDRPGSNVKAVFIAALDHERGAERAAYLDVACGDNADLRRRIEVLLAAHERAGEILNPAGE
jgi:hypothetical protein